MLILPATFGAGIYQISQLVDTFFATSLPQGSLTLLKYADRLNQMPLGIFGIALGTAILPMLARHIQADDKREAQRLQTERGGDRHAAVPARRGGAGDLRAGLHHRHLPGRQDDPGGHRDHGQHRHRAGLPACRPMC